MFPPLKFENNVLKLLDQRKLPSREIWISCRTSRQVHEAIREMVVRGAPAIGVTAGYGLYLGISKFKGSRAGFLKNLEREAAFLKTARPTAVNLRNVVDGIVHVILSPSFVILNEVKNLRANSAKNLQVRRSSAKQSFRIGKKRLRMTSVERLKRAVLEEARKAHREDDRLCRTMGRFGAALFKSGDRVLTHCNAGGLATSGFGTALGVLYAAKAQGKKLFVYVDETRPLLQGARLTAWELQKSGISCTLICDNMAASLMSAGKIDRVIVGADRIAANGDTANKIGTYNVALLAKAHGLPFYVAAPKTTFDFHCPGGKDIPIENRKSEEITKGFGKRTAPKGIQVWNPAFDVTPRRLISAFITEAGVLKPPFKKAFRKLT